MPDLLGVTEVFLGTFKTWNTFQALNVNRFKTICWGFGRLIGRASDTSDLRMRFSKHAGVLYRRIIVKQLQPYRFPITLL